MFWTHSLPQELPISIQYVNIDNVKSSNNYCCNPQSPNNFAITTTVTATLHRTALLTTLAAVGTTACTPTGAARAFRMTRTVRAATAGATTRTTGAAGTVTTAGAT